MFSFHRPRTLVGWSGELLPIEYDPDRTPEFLDAVIVNECHPSIYGA